MGQPLGHDIPDSTQDRAAQRALMDDRPYDSVRVPAEIPPDWSVGPVTRESLVTAERLEYKVFLDAGFCAPSDNERVDEYEPWREISEFVAATSPEGTIEGVVRMIFGRYEDLPVGKFQRDDTYPADPVLEYASLSVKPECRNTGVAEWLYRAVWQQVLRHGANGMVAIGEEWLMEILNDIYGLGFEQLGASEWYMGGDCFPMGTGVSELIERLNRQPSFFRWASSEIDLRDLPRPDVRSAVTALRSV